MDTYKQKRQRIADESAMYADGDMMISQAIRQGSLVHGWLQGRFLQVYPGGRATDLTAFVETPLHVKLVQG